MMNDSMINIVINSLTPEMGVRMAKRYGVDFTLEEATIIIPFLKAHKNELNKENKSRLLSAGRNLVSPATFNKVNALLNKVL